MEEQIVEASPNLFKSFLDHLVQIVYLIHKYILSLNDHFEANLSDKTLHFIFIGLLGIFLLFVIYPWFKWLADRNKVLVVSWIYVFTILVAITLLIEIGQGISGTGEMEFADIMAGLLGFVIMSLGYLTIRTYIKQFLHKDKK